MAKSQKLSNLSKQSRTVAQSASEYLMKPSGSFRLTAAPRDFQGASGTVNQFETQTLLHSFIVERDWLLNAERKPVMLRAVQQ